MELSEKLDYQPNKAALSLLKKHTSTIGVLVPNLKKAGRYESELNDSFAAFAGITTRMFFRQGCINLKTKRWWKGL